MPTLQTPLLPTLLSRRWQMSAVFGRGQLSAAPYPRALNRHITTIETYRWEAPDLCLPTNARICNAVDGSDCDLRTAYQCCHRTPYGCECLAVSAPPCAGEWRGCVRDQREGVSASASVGAGVGPTASAGENASASASATASAMDRDFNCDCKCECGREFDLPAKNSTTVKRDRLEGKPSRLSTWSSLAYKLGDARRGGGRRRRAMFDKIFWLEIYLR